MSDYMQKKLFSGFFLAGGGVARKGKLGKAL